MLTLGQTKTAVAMGTPIKVTPVTKLPIQAWGLLLARVVKAVVMVITPEIQRGPTTASPIQAQGRPFTMVVKAPGPMITSAVAVKLAIVATGVGITLPPCLQMNR
jgi:hypothetical protein